MTIKYKDNTKQYIKELKKHHGGLAIVSADTVNTAAKVVKKQYLKEIDKFKHLRSEKFTKKAVKILKSKATRSKGGFRPIKMINAIVGVIKMRGGKQHYLQKQEDGDIKPGSAKTMGQVAIPLDAARTSQSRSSKISGPLQLQKTTIQTLEVGGKPIGVPGSPFSPKQQWALLNRYMGTSRMKKNKSSNIYGWNKSKQFFFSSLSGVLGVFRKFGKKFSITRDLSSKTVRITAKKKFDKSFDRLTPKMMESIFKRAADKFLRRK